MAITFPASPVNGQTHTENGQIFVFDSTRGYWLLKKQDQIVASTSRSTFVATAGQTVHTVNYDPSASVIVSVNGVMLNPQDITSTNGTSVIFDTALALSDEVDIVFHQPTASNLIRQDISDPMATESYVQTYVTNNSSVGVTTVADMAALIALTGMANGDQALVTANNNLFIYSGSGWYKIATVQNDSPSAITGVSGTYELAIDGTATTITAASTDPEGFPLTWSYSTSGLGSIATVSHVDNVFTITPSTNEADIGTFTLTINATDGVNGAVSTSTNLTLEFIVIVTNSKYTSLLATAVDTSDNNNITDSSSNSHSITVNGDAYAGTFSPYRSGGYSTSFDGTGSTWIRFPTSTDFWLTDQSFHIGFWCYPKVLGDYDTIIAQIGTMAIELLSGSMRMWLSTGTVDGNWNLLNGVQISNTLNVNEWAYITVVRDSGNNTLKSYHNGTLVYNNTSFTGTVGDSTNSMDIGKYNTSNANSWNGYIRDLRYRVGSGSESTSNSVPTEAVTAEDSLTKLLTCHSTIISDGSSSARTPEGPMAGGSLTAGWKVVEPFSPYDYNEYSATVHGGSVYFDGAGDRITASTSNNFAIGSSEDFIIEAWIYPTNTSQGNFHLFGIQSATYNGGIYFDYNSSDFRIGDYGGGWDVRTTSTVPLRHNTWQHICASRTGNLIKIFFNGESLALSSQGEAHTNSYNAGDIAIGGAGVGTDFQGFISDIRFEKGTSRTSNFTPPTAPLSSTGAALHIKGTDASIIDKSQGANLKLEGNTTGSTTQVKFANTKSMYFDGNGDYIPIITDFFYEKNTSNASTTKFTIETWVYHTSRLTYSGYNHIFQTIVGLGNVGLSFGIGPSGNLKFYHQSSSTNVVTSTSTISLNTWTHIAVIVDGSQGSSGVTLKINGSTDGTGSWSGISTSLSDHSTPYSSPHFTIGRYPDSFQSHQQFQGYLQDLRISSYARTITSAPTASLEG